MFNPAYILPHTDCWIAQGSIGSFLPNMQTLSVTRASKGAETLFEKPLPALTTLVTTACKCFQHLDNLAASLFEAPPCTHYPHHHSL
eukprot:1160479-Pelagomonas_calceolata.AAC.6